MGNKKPTMHDVANLAGVSSMTVSRAFKKNSSISETTKEKIRKAANELGYIFNSNVSAFSSSKSGFIAVTIPSINNANFADTLSGLTKGLQNSGLQILLGHTGYSHQEEERLVEEFLQRRPEAFVVTGGSHTPQCDAMLRNADVPVFELWDTPKKPIDEVVGFSNAKAGALIVDHFVELGFDKMAFIGGEGERDTRGLDRKNGFQERLNELGLDDTRMITSGPPPISMREGFEAAGKLLEQWPDTQAVMCVSDLSAFGVISYCQQNNIKIPHDLAIAGFGAYEIAEISNPTITTINVGAYDIGLLAAKKLLTRLDLVEDENANVTDFEIQPKLIIGQSTRSDIRDK